LVHEVGDPVSARLVGGDDPGVRLVGATALEAVATLSPEVLEQRVGVARHECQRREDA
jgi:hypothetical protein